MTYNFVRAPEDMGLSFCDYVVMGGEVGFEGLWDECCQQIVYRVGEPEAIDSIEEFREEDNTLRDHRKAKRLDGDCLKAVEHFLYFTLRVITDWAVLVGFAGEVEVGLVELALDAHAGRGTWEGRVDEQGATRLQDALHFIH